MKILTKDGIYVQKNDIAYLTQSDKSIPESIFLTVFGQGSYTIIDDSNRYEFVKFTSTEEIEYLNALNWIVDYNSLKDLSTEELENKFNELADKRRALADKYNNMSIEEKMKNIELVDECENLRYMMLNINDINLFKHGRLSMTLPKGVERPTLDIENEQVEGRKAKGFQKVIKRVFKKS